MVNIIQGGIKEIIVRLTLASTKDPLPLTGVSEISTCFKNTDETELMLTKTGGEITVVGDPLLGKIQIALDETQTAALALVDSETMEIAVDFGNGPRKLQIANAYSVIASIC